MLERVGLVWNGVLDVIYPPRCLVCGARLEAGALCRACQEGIHPLPPPFCDRCGRPVSPNRLVCDACENGPEPSFAWSQAMGRYEGILRTAIHRLKYDGKTALAEPLGLLLARSLDEPCSPLLYDPVSDRTLTFDLVVPVPLHPARLRERGFNQAERLARVVARERGWRLEPHGLRRIRSTRSQTKLSPEERASNVRGAFVAPEPALFFDKTVLIIDDVLTTTATLAECARVAREAGASRVCIQALARG